LSLLYDLSSIEQQAWSLKKEEQMMAKPPSKEMTGKGMDEGEVLDAMMTMAKDKREDCCVKEESMDDEEQ